MLITKIDMCGYKECQQEETVVSGRGLILVLGRLRQEDQKFWTTWQATVSRLE